MLSYNNIVEKGEPNDIAPIESALSPSRPPANCSQRRIPNADCIVVDNFLSSEECDLLIQACEKVGYTFWQQALHHEQDGEKNIDENTKAVRIVDTIEAKFPHLSQIITERIKQVVKLETKSFSEDMLDAEALFERDIQGDWEPYGLSENLLLGRYRPGGHFMPHIDGSTIVDINTRSMYTLLIYLNDVQSGGETFLLSGDQCNITKIDEKDGTLRGSAEARIGVIKPCKGSAAFFYHNLLHEAAPVGEGGIKYICRADLLYKRNPPILTSKEDDEAFKLYERARVEESKGNALEACKMFQKVRTISRGVAELYLID